MIEYEALQTLREVTEVRTGEPLARHTTMGVGGPADAYAVARSAAELRDLVRAAQHARVPYLVLGSGSNVLVSDRGVRGIVIRNDASAVEGPLRIGEGPAHLVKAESGTSFAALARRLSRAGWAGLEWAVGIPGTLGGAVVYNAGAYGGCLADVLQRVTLIDERGEERCVEARDLGLRYRGSALKPGVLDGAVVLSLELCVYPDDAERLRQYVATLDERRRAAQPPGRNAGSTFKNPAERPAWWLIDQARLRGYRIGDAQISPKHANFFTNVGGAKAAHVKALMDLARERVREQFGLELEPEVTLVGDWDEP